MDFDRDIVAVYHSLQIIARMYCRDERAHDLAAEAVTRALEHRDCYDPRRPLLAWCRAIMRNLWINAGQRLETRCTVHMDDLEATGGVETDQRTIVGDFTEKIADLRLRSVCVDTLMDFAEGRTLSEISLARGVPLGTVKRRIHDGRKLLSKVLR